MGWLPEVEHDYPPCPTPLRWIGRLGLWLLGWSLSGPPPADGRKAVVLGYPHTSNWDYVLAVCAAWTYGLRLWWLGKKALFEGPLGGFLRWTGGIAVDRTAPHGLVGDLVARIEASEGIMLLVPPEGTRGPREYWKSGFYHIARQAGIPVICGKLDYERKAVGFGYHFHPSGDMRRDMDGVRAFYADAHGKYPHCVTAPRLRTEDAEDVPASPPASEPEG